MGRREQFLEEKTIKPLNFDIDICGIKKVTMSSSRSKVPLPGTVLLDDLNAGVEVLEAVWVDDAVGVDAVVQAEGEDGDLAAEAGVEAHLGRDTSGISRQWRLTLAGILVGSPDSGGSPWSPSPCGRSACADRSPCPGTTPAPSHSTT